MYYVYLISSKKKKWTYIGSTNELKRRFNEHNVGKVRSTKAHQPFELIYYEAYETKSLASKREIELKRKEQQKEILFERLEIG